MKKFLFFFTTFINSCSSNGQVSLIGEWKPIKVSYHNSFFSKTTTVIFDVDSVEKIKSDLFQKYISQDNTDSDLIKIDTLGYKRKLDNGYAKFDSARLVFKNNSIVYIASYGLIIPSVEPGWVFGDKVGGKWKNNSNKILELTIGDDKINHPFFYNIIKHNNDSLILGQTNGDGSEVFMTIEFARQ